jgi:hypothetical protein
MEFSNMGLIALISSMQAFIGINNLLLGFTGLTKSTYPGFTPDWYMDTGTGICFFIFMSSFLSNSADLQGFSIAVIRRFVDRGYKMHLKQDPEDEDDDVPNTKKKIQGDLEQLYMGKEFQGEKAYSRMMSTLFVILLYSSGMPILYVTGLVFYTATYLINKMLIMNYYQKSRTLTRTIPLFSVEFLQLGLIVHILGAFFMLTDPLAFSTSSEAEGLDMEFNPVEQVSQVEEGLGLEGNSEALGPFYERLKYYHQKLYIIFLFSFAASYLTGKTIYSLLMMAAKALWNIAKIVGAKISTCCKKIKRRIIFKMNKEEYHSETSESNDKDEMNLDAIFDLESSSFSCSSSESESEEESLDMMDAIGDALADKKVDHEQRKADRLKRKEEREAAREVKRQKMAAALEEKRKRIMEARRDRPDYSENIYNEFNCENLSSFYERAKKELADFRDVFNLEPNETIGPELLDPESQNPMRTVFQEICFMSRITSDQVEKYQKFLIQRIRDIEDAIDHHFNLIKATLISDHKEYFERERKRKKKAGIEGSLSQQLQDKVNEKNFLDKQMQDFNDLSIFTHEIRMQKLVSHYD